MATNIVDTNVLVVANGLAEHADAICVFSAKRLLYNLVQQDCRISFDFTGQIFEEYKRYASLSGQPNEGDYFLKWLLTNVGNPNRCELVDITPQPMIPEGFDPSDRKFLWTAILSNYPPATIHNAVDSDWAEIVDFLVEKKIALNEICSEE